MLKRTIAAVILACVSCLGAAPSTKPATTPATNPAAVETLAQKESRLASLRAQVSALESEIGKEKAATKPAVIELTQLVQSIPKDLWPTPQENAVHRSAREAWIKNNDFTGRVIKWTGPVIEIASNTKQTTVTLHATGVEVFGAKASVSVRGFFDPVESSASLMNLKSKDVITLEGTISSIEITPTSIRVDLKEATTNKKQ